ncbi:hypothetical protein EBME_1077 [bacterium endosymbiont of Mortierella elongata FMR23-6]|nr:hypothetical protein EBME_1077 [bacterium endosymbiont of Mortierella elongata FMR23-6]
MPVFAPRVRKSAAQISERKTRIAAGFLCPFDEIYLKT